MTDAPATPAAPPRSSHLPSLMCAGTLAAVVAACVGIFLLAAALTAFAHPQTDDMFRIVHAREYGYWSGLEAYYEIWGGRWLGWLGSAAPDLWSGLHRDYAILLLAPLLFLAGSIALLARRAGDLAWHWAALVGIAVIAVTFARARETGDFFYWWTGAWENQMGIALPILGLALLIRGSTATRVIGVAAIALTAGLHELYGLFVVVTLVPATAAAFTGNREGKWWWAAALGLGAISLAVSVLAPGNSVRAQQMEQAWSASAAVELGVLQLVDFARLWMVDAVTLSMLALVAASGLRRPMWCDRPVLRFGPLALRWEVVLPLLTLALVAGAVFSHAYSTGVPLPGRTRCAIQIVFVVGALASVLTWTAGRVPRWRTAQATAAGVFALALLLAPNVESGLRDLKTNAPLYDRIMQERHQRLLAAAAGDGHAVLPPLPYMPALYWDQGVSNDPDHYRNYHTRGYYGLKSVRVAAE